MNPIITQMSTVSAERRDSALTQATTAVELLKSLGVEDANSYKQALTEILTESLPGIGSNVNSWSIDTKANAEEGGMM